MTTTNLTADTQCLDHGCARWRCGDSHTAIVLVRSDRGDGGWSLHAPGSTDEDIADGTATALVSGPAEMVDDDWSRPSSADYAAAERRLSCSSSRTEDVTAEHHARILSTPAPGSYQHVGYAADSDLHTYRTTEDNMTTTRYEIKTGPEHHSEERPWMRLASTVTVEAKTVGERCSYVAVTRSPGELEAALNADADVIEYAARN